MGVTKIKKIKHKLVECVLCHKEYRLKKSYHIYCPDCYASGRWEEHSRDKDKKPKLFEYKQLVKQVGTSKTRKVFICEGCGNPTILFKSEWDKKHLCRECGDNAKTYPLGWTNIHREHIRQRDDYKCQVCGCPEIENGRNLDVHHINYDKKDISWNNLISLCRSCHAKTNGNREEWQHRLEGIEK